MIWTKAKYAVAAAGMLVVSGVGALGQQPAATSTTSSEPAAEARLKQVEQKLDRVLQALESPRRGAAEIGSRTPFYYTPFGANGSKPAQASERLLPPSPATKGDSSKSRVVSVDENSWTEVYTVRHLGKPPADAGGPPPAGGDIVPGFVTVMIPRTVAMPDGRSQVVSDTYRQPAGQSDAPLTLVRYADPAPTTAIPVPPPPVTTRPMPVPTPTARADGDSELERRVAALEKRLDRLEKLVSEAKPGSRDPQYPPIRLETKYRSLAYPDIDTVTYKPSQPGDAQPPKTPNPVDPPAPGPATPSPGN